MIRHSQLALLLSVYLLSALPGALAQAEVHGDEEIPAMQRRIIQQLSGGAARSTPAERAAAATFLAATLEEFGLTPVRQEYRLPNKNPLVDLLLPPYRGINLYAVIEATTPSDQYVIFGAHYDSEPGSPGAVDNASGVALVCGVAAALTHLDERRLNFIPVLFDQEEDDEIGSQAFVRYLQEQPWVVHSVHIADLVGWDSDGDRAVEVQSPGPHLEPRYLQAASLLGIPIHLTSGRASDTWPFRDAGLRSVGIWEEYEHGDSTPHLHRPSDTYDTVDFAYLSSTTALVLEVLKSLSEDAP